MSERQLSIRVSDELYAQLKRVAEREERSVSQTIRRALRQYCDKSASGLPPRPDFFGPVWTSTSATKVQPAEAS